MSFSVDKSVLIDSCKKLLSSGVHLEISSDQEFEEIIKNQNLRRKIEKFNAFSQWKENDLNPQTFDSFAIDWIFLCDLLNFSFWKDENRKDFDVEFNGKVYKNYWSLPATLNKHARLLIDPKFYSQITEEQFDHIFNPNIPLKEERIRLMNEAGKVLVDNYEGSFSIFLKRSESKDVWSFINCLLNEFPSFRDYNESGGAWFLKRAQILVTDLWAASDGKFFNDSINQLTIFADYRYSKFLNHV